MKLHHLFEMFTTADALQSVSISLRDLNVLLQQNINHLQQMLQSRDNSSLMVVRKSLNTWLERHYFGYKGTGGGNSIESALSHLKNHTKYTQAAKRIITSIRTYAQRDKRDLQSSRDNVEILLMGLVDIASINGNKRLVDDAQLSIDLFNRYNKLIKQVKSMNTPSRERSVSADDGTSLKAARGEQNNIVQQVINDQLRELPKQTADDFRRKLSRSDNKLQLLHQLMQQYTR